MLLDAFRALWASFRKGLFIMRYNASRDPGRARREAEGDPLLEPYLRFLVKRGFIKMGDESAGRPL